MAALPTEPALASATAGIDVVYHIVAIYRQAGLPDETYRAVNATAVQQIIDRLCGGSVEQLIVGMVDRELLDERELRRLVEKLARRKNRTGKEQDVD